MFNSIAAERMERMQEIVWKYLRYKTKKAGKGNIPDKREIKRIAKALQLPPEQVAKAARALLYDQDMSQMTSQDRRSNGQVAIGYILYNMLNSREGLKIGTLRRSIGNISKAIDEPLYECKNCAKFLIMWLVKEELS